jgi:hypothetical protein
MYGEACSTQESTIRFETELVICFPIGQLCLNIIIMCNRCIRISKNVANVST